MDVAMQTWREQADRYLDEIKALMREAGWPMKEAKLICDDVSTQCPIWCGKSEEHGEIRIDYRRHEPGAVAHEFAHGVHEKMRSCQKYAHALSGNGSNGEEFAQMVRYEVERRMQWKPNQDTGMYDLFRGNWQAFRKAVDGESAWPSAQKSP